MDFLKKMMGDKKAPKDDKKPAPKREPSVIGGKNPRNEEALKAAGMKKGGKVKKPAYKKGGMCR